MSKWILNDGSSDGTLVSVTELIKASFHMYQKNLVFHFGNNILRFIVKIFVNSSLFCWGLLGFFDKTET